jgi:glycerol-3-phosphate cytidylyltransferase-like family protein
MKKEIVVAVSGYFDPIHVGHLEYLQLASQLGDKLIVIINNNHRMEIVAALKCVDEVFLSIDSDKSVCKSLEAIKPDIFANGGDRSLEEIPETVVMKKYNIKMVDGLGDKIRSSSDLTGIGK